MSNKKKLPKRYYRYAAIVVVTLLVSATAYTVPYWTQWLVAITPDAFIGVHDHSGETQSVTVTYFQEQYEMYRHDQ
jgi:hypothetical protein